MKPKQRVHLALAGLSLLVLLVVRRHARPALPPARFSVARLRPVRPDSLFERSLRQAWTLRTHAIVAENREREALEEWDPAATAGSATESIRRQHLARDRGGELRRARTAAREAAALARTPMDAYRAEWLLARIDCNLGDHRAELQEARRSIRLAPQRWEALETLHHALVCNGLAPVAPPAGEPLP